MLSRTIQGQRSLCPSCTINLTVIRGGGVGGLFPHPTHTSKGRVHLAFNWSQSARSRIMPSTTQHTHLFKRRRLFRIKNLLSLGCRSKRTPCRCISQGKPRSRQHGSTAPRADRQLLRLLKIFWKELTKPRIHHIYFPRIILSDLKYILIRRLHISFYFCRKQLMITLSIRVRIFTLI